MVDGISRALLGLIALLLCAALVQPFLSTRSASAGLRPQDGTIRAQRFVLVDAQGRELAYLGVSDNDAGATYKGDVALAFLDRGSNPVGAFGMDRFHTSFATLASATMPGQVQVGMRLGFPWVHMDYSALRDRQPEHQAANAGSGVLLVPTGAATINAAEWRVDKNGTLLSLRAHAPKDAGANLEVRAGRAALTLEDARGRHQVSSSK